MPLRTGRIDRWRQRRWWIGLRDRILCTATLLPIGHIARHDIPARERGHAPFAARYDNIAALCREPRTNALRQRPRKPVCVERHGDGARHIRTERHENTGRLLVNRYANDFWKARMGHESKIARWRNGSGHPVRRAARRTHSKLKSPAERPGIRKLDAGQVGLSSRRTTPGLRARKTLGDRPGHPNDGTTCAHRGDCSDAIRADRAGMNGSRASGGDELL
jgi:hypothetical protein